MADEVPFVDDEEPVPVTIWFPVTVEGEIRHGTDTPLWLTPEEIERLKEASA